MNKLLYNLYNSIFFHFLYRDPSMSLMRVGRWFFSSKVGIYLLRCNTKYYIKLYLKHIFTEYKLYDGVDTRGLLQLPKRLREISIYGYLIELIGLGWHPTLKSCPVTVDEILKLNTHKSDDNFTKFLTALLSNHWSNPDRRITKVQLDKILQN